MKAMITSRRTLVEVERYSLICSLRTSRLSTGGSIASSRDASLKVGGFFPAARRLWRWWEEGEGVEVDLGAGGRVGDNPMSKKFCGSCCRLWRRILNRPQQALTPALEKGPGNKILRVSVGIKILRQYS